jgi:hypothetical protein
MVEDKKLLIKPLEKDSTLRKSSCLEETKDDLRLNVMKEKILEWFSKTYVILIRLFYRKHYEIS